MWQLIQLFSVSAPVQSALQKPLNQPAAMIYPQTEQLLPQSALLGTAPKFLPSHSLAFHTLGGDSGGEKPWHRVFSQVPKQASSLWTPQDYCEKE